MFQKACSRAALAEGRYEVALVDKKVIVILWPVGGRPKAFQGFCPHKREPLIDGRFDGRTLSCERHDWLFDATTGTCLKGKKCHLAEYKLKIDGDAVLVDVEGIKENYLRSG